MRIETENLILIPGTKNLLTSAIQGNDFLSKALGYAVCSDWTEFGVAPLAYTLKILTQSENENGWWTYFPIHTVDQKLIGSCGYKGKPSLDGMVEIGYEVCPEYRQKGYGTEIANGLLTHAFKDEHIKIVIAHTLPMENASTNILRKLSFNKVSEIEDPEDGLIWRWEIKKP